jgi:hypothetical protein
MGAAILESLAAIHTTIQLLKEARSIWREVKPARGGAPEELERKFDELEQQLQLAESTAAKDLGYPLCRKHWPPRIMTVSRVDDDGLEYWRCQECGREQGPPRIDRGRGHW